MAGFFRRVLAALLLLTITTAPSLAQLQAFTSEAGQFSIMMYGKPRQTTEEFPSPDGSFTLKAHHFLAQAPTAAHGVSYADYPKGYVVRQRDQILTNMQRGLLSGKTLLWERRVNLAGHPGVAFRTDDPANGFLMEVWIVAVEDRVYQLMIVTEKSQPEWANRQTFIDSFRPLK